MLASVVTAITSKAENLTLTPSIALPKGVISHLLMLFSTLFMSLSTPLKPSFSLSFSSVDKDCLAFCSN